jgi:DegV family protein with EDD domain
MKKPIAIVTDSAANIPQALVERHAIEVIPLWVQIEDRSYRDGIDIHPLEFFRRLREKVRRVGTSQPSLGEFLEFYRRVQERAESIVSVHLAGRYSGILNAARAAAAELAPFPIEVVDSGTVAMAQGFAALVAARAAEAGASLVEVVQRVKAAIPRIDLIATVESLEWAVRGGRLAWAARLVDNLLRVKPLLRVRGNQVDLIGQARTRGKAVRRLLDVLAERVGDAPLHVAVLYSGAIEEAQRVKEEIVSRFRCVEVYVEWITPVLGVHAGPGTLGLAFYADE